MKILVRLPNWLGDMVMAVGAIHQLAVFFPEAEISLVAKKGIHELLSFFPPAQHRFLFDKDKYKGLKGLWRFGRSIRRTEKFDLFFSFPDSFSAALMGYASGAKARVGYKNEGRNLLLTHSYAKPFGLHRVNEYVRLLEIFSENKAGVVNVLLNHSFPKQDYIVVNINSEASSRRLTTDKAAEIISAVRRNFDNKIMLVGSPGEKAFVEEVFCQLPEKAGIENLAGTTSLKDLAQVLASAKLMLTTDSGPAHLANAMGTQTVVLFGAGNENNTAPYNKEAVDVIRLGKLSCEPCTKNVCVQFSTPQCLELLETKNIVAAMRKKIEA
jgi:ADP-heptose:LPS heptosyltransferase